MNKLIFIFALILILSSVSHGEGSGVNYLPLEVGNKWELRSPVTEKPIVFEVTGRADAAYRVRWDNPWVPSELQFVVSGNQVFLQAIDMGQGVYTLPSPLLYFDFSTAENITWSNALGQMTILSRQRTISTPTKQFERCIEIRTTDEKGESNYWTFAPGVGFVQFGQGQQAFVLSAFTRSEKTTERQTSRLLIGIDANPPAGESYAEAVAKSVRRAVDAGVTYLHLAPKWDEMEPKPGKYSFEGLISDIGRTEPYHLPVELGVRIIDTNQRSMPDAYKSWNLDDPRLAEKLNDLLRALAPQLKGRAKWVTIGNEVNVYFDAHKKEIEPYTRLLDRVIGTVRGSFPGALFSVNFTGDAASRLHSDYEPIISRVDFVSFTYYPLNPDFTVKTQERVRTDLQKMIDAGGKHKVLFQEIGCPSATRLNSSEERQGHFLEQAFQILKENKDRIIAANILWMSDLPDSLVDQFGKYYSLPGNENFKAYLATLGLFDKQGKPKLAWKVFEGEAQALAQR